MESYRAQYSKGTFTMIEFNVCKAFLDSVNSRDYCEVVQEPNTALTNPPSALWLALHLLPTLSEPVTLGENGEDNHEGLFQIDINYPLNSGLGEVLLMADRIAKDYVAGTTLTYNGSQVKIMGSSLSPGRVAGGFYKASLTIRYYARSIRS